MNPAAGIRGFAALIALNFACGNASADTRTLWDMKHLSKPPVAVFGARDELVQEVTYQGEPHKGKPTRIFAYYARPDGAGPFPGIVLVHGGGGKAFKEWAVHWAKRGYAAISMDLSGNRPESGPDQSHESKFRQFQDSEAREMWTYHSVANAILAHSLLASRPEVNRRRIGITGISWGGYLTCIIAGVDHRFKAAVPVYGCGFLHENSTWKESILDKLDPDLRERWVRLFDPSRYLPNLKCPILFLNGTNDFAYPMDSYKKCFNLVNSTKSISVQIRLPHGHIWTFGIVDAFIDQHLNNGRPLTRLKPMTVQNGIAESRWESGGKPVQAELYFTTDSGPWHERAWKAASARIEGRWIRADLPAYRPLTFHLAVTDSAGSIITTTHSVLPGSEK